MSRTRSRVHPKFKTKYRAGNWPEYDASGVAASPGVARLQPPRPDDRCRATGGVRGRPVAGTRR